VISRHLLAALVVAAALSLGAQGSHAQIVRVELTGRESPALGGVSFGDAGVYERLTGRVYGELDPSDSRNAIITDLDLAPRTPSGTVAYAADFVLLKPVDMGRANGVLRYMAPNRGRMLERPDSLDLAQGTVFLWGAWQGDVPAGEGRLTLAAPVARQPDGSSIKGLVRVELAGRPGAPLEMPLQGNVYNAGQIPYAPAALDDAGDVLTRRVRETYPRIYILRDAWAFASCDRESAPFPGAPSTTTVCVADGFQPDYLYELVYRARDPKVLGIGLAAVRDMVSFFRFASAENPLTGSIRHAMGTGISQAGNFMKTFVHLGFNEDLEGRRVFDALFPLVAARQTNINARFAVPGGGGGVRLDHRAFGQTAARGFAADYVDEIRGEQGGIFTRCEASNTCPKTFLGLSGSEMWVLQGSPVLTDAYGTRDLVQPDNLRIYYFAGTQHGTAPIAWNPELTLYPAGVQSDYNPLVRALWQRLTEWMMDDTPPPPSRVPRLADGTLVRPEELEYPAMSGVSFLVDGRSEPIAPFRYLGWYNSLGLLDFGPRFDESDETGIADWQPPAYMGKDYAILVPAVGADGNEIAGVQPVGNAAPLGTNLTYNYGADLALGDLFWLSGSFIPFHITREDRLAAGDERLSLEELYGDHAGYVAAVRRAAEQLVAQGFLLRVDADRLIAEAEQSGVLR
jgi:hypothetical protein